MPQEGAAFHVAPEKLLPVGQVLQQRLIVELTGSFLPTDDRANFADQWKGGGALSSALAAPGHNVCWSKSSGTASPIVGALK
jgi:hypothetical protein